MSNIKYNMTFDEVLHEIFETKGWYQGEEFKDGVYITVDDYMTIVGKEFSNYKNLHSWPYSWPLNITYGVTQMKYRRVYTQPEVERKC